MTDSLNTPVLFLIFNRPDATREVFDQIKLARPRYLFVAADGPRKDVAGERERCDEARQITREIDWDCEVKTLFRDVNLGCRVAVSSAIDWFFEQVEEGIILEDDCLPHPSFFQFCEELLAMYRNDHRVFHISGINFQGGKTIGKGSYFFSNYPMIWGWATWQRAWKQYDVHMNSFPSFQQSRKIKQVLKTHREQKLFLKTLRMFYLNSPNSWDIQWVYAIWDYHATTIAPNVPLVKNIGISLHNTHTFLKDSKRDNISIKEIKFPLIHPEFEISHKADTHTFRLI